MTTLDSDCRGDFIDTKPLSSAGMAMDNPRAMRYPLSVNPIEEAEVGNEELQRVMDLWTNDPEFRAELRANPDAALQRHGIQLDESERRMLSDSNWEAGELLAERVSKGVIWGS